MVPQFKLQAWLEWWRYLRHALCPHDIVPHFTMDSIHHDKWMRISGAGQCRKCGLDFSVSIAKDDTELYNEHYLGRV